MFHTKWRGSKLGRNWVAFSGCCVWVIFSWYFLLNSIAILVCQRVQGHIAQLVCGRMMWWALMWLKPILGYSGHRAWKTSNSCFGDSNCVFVISQNLLDICLTNSMDTSCFQQNPSRKNQPKKVPWRKPPLDAMVNHPPSQFRKRTIDVPTKISTSFKKTPSKSIIFLRVVFLCFWVQQKSYPAKAGHPKIPWLIFHLIFCWPQKKPNVTSWPSIDFRHGSCGWGLGRPLDVDFASLCHWCFCDLTFLKSCWWLGFVGWVFGGAKSDLIKSDIWWFGLWELEWFVFGR